MGLTLNQRPAGTKERAANADGDDPDEAARKERVEALKAAIRRIKGELAVVSDRKDRLFLDLEPVLTRRCILDDPFAAASDLDGFLRDGEDLVDKICALIPGYLALDMDLAALEHEEGLAHGHGLVADAMADLLKNVWEFIAHLRSLADVIRAGAAAGSRTDASAAGDLESASAMDPD